MVHLTIYSVPDFYVLLACSGTLAIHFDSVRREGEREGWGQGVERGRGGGQGGQGGRGVSEVYSC